MDGTAAWQPRNPPRVGRFVRPPKAKRTCIIRLYSWKPFRNCAGQLLVFLRRCLSFSLSTMVRLYVVMMVIWFVEFSRRYQHKSAQWDPICNKALVLLTDSAFYSTISLYFDLHTQVSRVSDHMKVVLGFGLDTVRLLGS